MYLMIVTSDGGSSSNITIPASPVTSEGGRPSNSSHGATGGPRCLGTLDSTPRRATSAAGPRSNATNRSASYIQPQPRQQDGTRSVYTSLSSFLKPTGTFKGTYPSAPPPPIPSASATSIYISLSYYRLTFISLFILIFTLRSDPPLDPPGSIRRTLSHSCIHPPVYIQLSYDIYLYYFQNLLQPALEQGQYIFGS